MKKEYDFSNSVKNPYIKKLKRQISIRIEEDIIQYFKDLAKKSGIPYQNLINLYLKECVLTKKKISIQWD